MQKITFLSSVSIGVFLTLILVTATFAQQNHKYQGSGVIQEPMDSTADSFIYLPVIMKPIPPKYKIVFASDYENVGGVYDIYIMNTDGTSIQNLTNTPDITERLPVWSPDGSKIAYISTDGLSTTDEISIMDADGGNRIYVNIALARFPAQLAWAPNSQRIAFASDQGNNSEVYDIFVVNRDGSGLTNLTNSHDRSDQVPHWSSDSAKIVFTSDTIINPSSVRNIISRVDANGSHKTDLYVGEFGANFWPQWLPDDSKISFIIGNDYDPDCLVTINPDGTNDTCVSNFSGLTDVHTFQWNSAASKLLIFGFTDWNSEYPNLFIHDLATQQLQYLAHNINLTEYDWSPDESQVVYSIGYEGNIFIVNSDGTGNQNLTESLNSKNRYPDWSPVPIP